MLNYRLMGRSGLRVSDVALGTMLFGATSGWGVSAETAKELYDTFRAEGGNYLDTANQYAGGESERIIGGLVAEHREEVVIASKYTNSAPRNGDANAGGNQRKNMVQSVEGSLRRLNTDYLDLYSQGSTGSSGRTERRTVSSSSRPRNARRPAQTRRSP
ncbi:aldo/keto reductase, partial [Streptomyces sp. NPDC000405]|uniref:aldo/keto reductase n=1 Tax=Streptomyces sp. NPDC000405 TaxID=3161033 RepID=UPI00398CB9DB